MGRPSSKSELTIAAHDKYNQLMTLIDSLSEQEQKRDFIFPLKTSDTQAHWKRDKNIKDVIVHLYEWHNLLIRWVTNNKKGLESSFFPDGYNWRNYGELNVLFQKRNNAMSLEQAIDFFKKSNSEVMDLVSTFNDEELFTKGYYGWCAGTTLGSYFVSTTSSHYEWAIRKINKQKRALKQL